jgi:hypothetical protein
MMFHYLIEPRSELRERLRESAEAYVSAACHSVSWRSTTGGHEGWTEEDRCLRVKFLYLARLREMEGLWTDEQFEAAFGSAVLSGDVFDRWWTIRELAPAGSAEDHRSALQGFLHSIKPTGNEKVDDWLKALRNNFGLVQRQSSDEIAAELINSLERMREICPTFRLGQMMDGIVNTARDEQDYGIYDIEDEDFRAAVERWAINWSERARRLNAE